MTGVPRSGPTLSRAATLLAVVAYATAADLWPAGVAMGLAVILSAWLPKARVTPLGQLALALVAVSGAWFLTVYLGPLSHEFRSFEQLNALGWFAGMAALLAVISRQFVESRWLGARGDAILNFAAMVGAGDAMVDPYYPAYVVLFLPLQLIALARNDPARPPWRGLTRLHRGVTVAAVFSSLAVAAALIIGLPLGYDWSIDYFTNLYLQHRAGFSTEFSLGSMEYMFQSDEPVMRITGARPDYLRGIVYSRYQRGSWLIGEKLRKEKVTLPEAPLSGLPAATVRIVGGEQDRFFLPLRAERIQAGAVDLSSDETGVLTCARGEAKRVRFALGPRDAPKVAPPTDEDRLVPEAIRPALAEIASRWAGGASGTRARLAALMRRLEADYVYSLSFSRNSNVDPVLDFLTRKKEGHCEYFAAALALLARSLGIPARVVGGYVVPEYNGLGNYYVVRKRHAHAWVEAWIDGSGWRTYDPTPAGPLAGQMAGGTGGLRALTDLAAYWWDEGIFWVSGLTSGQVAAAIAFLLAVWFLIRWIRALRERRRARGAWQLSFSDPLPELLLLLDFLNQKGEAALSGEPLERFAERLSRSEALGPSGAEAAGLLSRYAAFRYGRHGEEGDIAAMITSWLAGQRKSPRSGATSLGHPTNNPHFPDR